MKNSKMLLCDIDSVLSINEKRDRGEQDVPYKGDTFCFIFLCLAVRLTVFDCILYGKGNHRFAVQRVGRQSHNGDLFSLRRANDRRNGEGAYKMERKSGVSIPASV